MKAVLIFLSLMTLVAPLARAQEPDTSKSDHAADSVFRRLSHELSSRSGVPEDQNPIGRKPVRIVFLVDSSQFSSKDFLPGFVGKVASGLLLRIARAQAAAQVPDESRDAVSVYPYQLHLIKDPIWVLSGKILKRGENTIQAVVKHIPQKRLPIQGETDLGHDSSGSRRELITELGLANGPRPTLIVQFTPTGKNSDPDHPDNNSRISPIDSRSGMLDGTDYVVYDDDGRYFQTDPPGHGVSASDVYIWVYGPAKFDIDPIIQHKIPPPLPPPPPPPSNPLPIVLGSILGVAGLWFIYRVFVYSARIELDGEVGKVSVLHPVGIFTSGGAKGDHALEISNQLRGRLSPGLKVAEVTLPIFGSPTANGAAGHTINLNNSAKSNLSLTKKPVKVTIGKGDDRSEPISLKLH